MKMFVVHVKTDQHLYHAALNRWYEIDYTVKGVVGIDCSINFPRNPTQQSVSSSEVSLRRYRRSTVAHTVANF